jgi:ubiquinone biosynthesis protein UbiJ
VSAPPLLLAALEAGINHVLALDPDALARIARLEGDVIAVEVSGTGLTVYAAPGPGGLMLLGRYEGEAQLTLRGPPGALLRLAQDPTSLDSGVELAGDTELATRLQAVLSDLEVDWEEQIARLLGDIPAHQLGNLWRGATTWGREARDSLAEDIEDYLKEETRLLPQRHEVDDFLSQVDRLRDDADRAEARIARLERRARESDGPTAAG